jgi:hypothetical protein
VRFVFIVPVPPLLALFGLMFFGDPRGQWLGIPYWALATFGLHLSLFMLWVFWSTAKNPERKT